MFDNPTVNIEIPSRNEMFLELFRCAKTIWELTLLAYKDDPNPVTQKLIRMGNQTLNMAGSLLGDKYAEMMDASLQIRSITAAIYSIGRTL